MKRPALFILVVSILFCHRALAGGFYIKPDEFIAKTFADGNYKQNVIWLDNDLKDSLKSILGHNYKGLRVRYWIDGTKTAWILEETGKEKPITVGIVVDDDKIERVRILAFRETRGWEVKHSFFTNQFIGASLLENTENNQLNSSIDNISGATLSVRAVKKLSRIALLLHRQVTLKNP